MILDDKLGQDTDAFYNALMDLHEGLSEAQSHALNARLASTASAFPNLRFHYLKSRQAAADAG